VEIDLLRGGQQVAAVPPDLLRRPRGAGGLICCKRARRPDRHEVCACPLRERLPVFAVPLGQTDVDIPLDLQPLINQCYEMGRHDMDRHDFEKLSDFEEDDAAWVQERLLAAGIVGD